MSKRGQVFSTDLVLSVSIFIILLLIVISFFYFYSLRISDAIKNEDLKFKALQISDVLAKSGGEPGNWESDPTNADVLGLAVSDRTFTTVKVKEFVKLDEDVIKNKLNIESFNFYFSLKDPNGALYDISDGDFSEVGSKPSLEAKKIVTIKRIVTYGGQEAFMEFSIWE